MEDAILGNSKGATYKSFILDIEIVIKKEGDVNIAEGRVKNKNPREENESQDPKQRNVSERKAKQDVNTVSAGQPNLQDLNTQPKEDDLLVEKSKISTPNDCFSTDYQTSVSSENIGVDLSYDQRQNKHFLSNEINFSETSCGKNQKKTEAHKVNHSSKYFKQKVKPVEFLEGNRLFMSTNYFQLLRQSSDSVLCYNNLKIPKNILLGECECDLDKIHKLVTRSADEILTLLKSKTSIWNENTNERFCSSTMELGKIYSCGDNDALRSFELCKDDCEKLPVPENDNFSKSSPENFKLVSLTPDKKLDESQRNSTKACMSTLELKCCIKTEHTKGILPAIIIPEFDFKSHENGHCKMDSVVAFIQVVKNIKRSLKLSNTINRIKKIIFNKA